MPEPDVPPSVTAAVRAADDQATTEARQDALAVLRFWGELVVGGVPEDLAADLTRTWLDSYLDVDGEV